MIRFIHFNCPLFTKKNESYNEHNVYKYLKYTKRILVCVFRRHIVSFQLQQSYQTHEHPWQKMHWKTIFKFPTTFLNKCESIHMSVTILLIQCIQKLTRIRCWREQSINASYSRTILGNCCDNGWPITYRNIFVPQSFQQKKTQRK